MPGGFDRPFEGQNNILFGEVQVRNGGQVFRQGLSGDGEAMAVQQSFLQEVSHYGGDASVLVQVLHEVFAAGFEVRQYRDLIADSLEVVLCKGDVYASGHGDQVEYGIGASAQDHDHGDGVLEGFAGHDIFGLNIFFQEDADGCSGVQAFFFLFFAEVGVGRGEGEAHTS